MYVKNEMQIEWRNDIFPSSMEHLYYFSVEHDEVSAQCWVVFDITWYHEVSTNKMTSSNGNIFRVTGPLCGEITGLRWIPHTEINDAEL